MSLFEHFDSRTGEQVAPEPEKTEQDTYFEHFPEGVRRDIEKALHQTSRWSYLHSTESPMELRILASEIFERIVTPQKHLPAFTEPVLQAIKEALNENEDWEDYDDIALVPILRKLKEMGILVKVRTADEIKKDL